MMLHHQSLPPLGFTGSSAARLAASIKPPPMQEPDEPVSPGDPPGFLRVEFDADEGDPIGLTIDWSMPLPVVSRIELGSLASEWSELSPGDVLIAVNRCGLQFGLQRSEVETLLVERPLSLVLEKPDPRRLGQMNMAPWRRPWKRGCAALERRQEKEKAPVDPDAFVDDWASPTPEPSEVECSSLPSVPPLDLSRSVPAFSEQSPPNFLTTGQMWLDKGDRRNSHALALSSSLSPHAFGKTLSPLPMLPSTEMKDEISSTAASPDHPPPMLRHPMPRVLSECLLRGQDLTDLRMWHLDDSRSITLPRLTKAIAPLPAPRSMSRSASRRQIAWGGQSVNGVVSKHSFKSLKCMAKGVPLPPEPDACYELVATQPRNYGPGPSSRWPLDHADSSWICRLTDLILATRIREAYEYGFRAKKRERVANMEQSMHQATYTFIGEMGLLCGHDGFVQEVIGNKPGDTKGIRAGDKIVNVGTYPFSKERLRSVENSGHAYNVTVGHKDIAHRTFKRMSRVEEVSCDMCGVLLLDKEHTGPFYFCRQCKRHGTRYELCVTCHALEVIQGEGKHHGEELHPHWEHCAHQDLQKCSTLLEAYPHAPHLWRASCDFCGHPVHCATVESDHIYVCNSCPEKFGLRFELCESCVVVLQERGFQAMRDTFSKQRSLYE